MIFPHETDPMVSNALGLTVSAKERERRQIAEMTEQYLAAGKTITEAPILRRELNQVNPTPTQIRDMNMRQAVLEKTATVPFKEKRGPAVETDHDRIEAIERMRAEHGITYKDVAKQAGVAPSTVSSVLQLMTRNPRKTMVDRISEAVCQVSLAKLAASAGEHNHA